MLENHCAIVKFQVLNNPDAGVRTDQPRQRSLAMLDWLTAQVLPFRDRISKA